MLRLILIIIIIAVVLGYFGFNLRDIVEAPESTSNLEYLKNIGIYFITWIWDFIKAFIVWLTALIS